LFQTIGQKTCIIDLIEFIHADFPRMYVGSVVRQRGLADILATTNSLAQVYFRARDSFSSVISVADSIANYIF
jgi:hypothetical protein